MGYVLVVDDEASIGWALREALSDEGHRVDLAASAEEGLRRPQNTRPDAVVLDVRLPGIDGLAAIRLFREQFDDPPIVVMTAFGDLQTAVRAVEAGAFEYLIKPFDLDRAAAIVNRAVAARHGRSHSSAPRPEQAGDPDAPRLIGHGAAMHELFKQVALVARADVPVLITGESGTGKELVARAIHRHGHRADGPFLPVAVPALSPTLIERELFGHIRGAFTGADHDRPGLLERASGGTVLLDEIGDVPLELQVKLLRAIEYREVVPVGGAQARAINVRIVAATNQPLARLMAEGRFRDDLFFRLSVFPIRVPPLRERPEDIAPLAEHFARVALAWERDRDSSPLTQNVIQQLQARPWPGNVRELRNAIEYAAIVARGGPIDAEHLPAHTPHASVPNPSGDDEELGRLIAAWVAERMSDPNTTGDLYNQLLALIEPPLLRAVLLHSRDNRLAAASRLGIHRGTLRQKLKAYGIQL